MRGEAGIHAGRCGATLRQPEYGLSGTRPGRCSATSTTFTPGKPPNDHYGIRSVNRAEYCAR